MNGDDTPFSASVWIDATPEQVFPFFVDQACLTQWLGEAAELDPVPKGRFAVDIGHRMVRGKYLQLDPPHRVVFSWGDAGSAALPPGATRVEIDLIVADRGTTVTLHHYGLRGEERLDHSRGWPLKLDELARQCTG